MEKNKVLKQVVAIIRSYLDENYKIYLFGSWAKNSALPTSDLDIAILGRKKISWETMAKIRQEIENVPTLRQIDIVDLNSVGKDFRKNILKSGKLLT